MALLKNSPKQIFFIGTVVFILGYASIFIYHGYFQFLEPFGALISSYAIIKWLRNPGFREKFKRAEGEDGLTYFWNKLVIKLWVGILFLFMFFNSLFYFLKLILK